MNISSPIKLSGCLILLIAVGLTAYWPGLCGPFLMDDFYNLEPLGYNGGITSWDALAAFAMSGESGVLGRVLPMLSFALDDQYWPAPSCSFKYTNLMIHLLCGMLMLLVTLSFGRALSLPPRRAMQIAFLTTAIWLLHPLNVSTTLYVVQRMTQMMTLFSLMAIYLYCLGVERIESRRSLALTLMTIGLGGFGLLALLSKENAVLLLLLIPITRYTLFARFGFSSPERLWNIGFLLIPLLLLIGYFLVFWDFSVAYESRSFTLSERLMTESRILLDYLYQIIFPRSRGTGLVHDDFVVSTSLFNPPSTIIAIGAILFLCISAYLVRNKYPVYSFAIAWFFSGHLLESTFVPLELYFEHRNYLPMLGPLFGLCYGCFQGATYLRKKSASILLKGLPVVLVLLCGMLTWQSAIIWGSSDRLFRSWSVEHPRSARAQKVYAANLLARDKPEEAIAVLSAAKQYHPQDIAIDIRMLEIACQHDINVGLNGAQLLAKAPNASFSDTLHASLEGLTREVLKGCAGISTTDLHRLLEILEVLPSVQANARYLANIYFLHAEIYLHQRNLNAAMELMDKSFAIDPSLSIALHQALVLSSAGLYEDALQYLDTAMRMDEKRRPLVPSRLAELERLALIFRQQSNLRENN